MANLSQFSHDVIQNTKNNSYSLSEQTSSKTNNEIKTSNGRDYSQLLNPNQLETAKKIKFIDNIEQFDNSVKNENVLENSHIFDEQEFSAFFNHVVKDNLQKRNLGCRNLEKHFTKETFKKGREEGKSNEQIVRNTFDKAYEEGDLFKIGPQGEERKLPEEEFNSLKEDLIREIADLLENYIHNQLLLLEHKEENQDSQSKTDIKPQQEYKAFVLTNVNHRELAGEKQFLIAIEIHVLGKIIILQRTISEKLQEKRTEEEREQKLLNLIDRIKYDIIKREISSNEIKKSGINLEELKGRLNKYIDMTLKELVDIDVVYSKIFIYNKKEKGEIKENEQTFFISHKTKPINKAVA